MAWRSLVKNSVRISFKSIICRIFAVSTIVLLCYGAYHYSSYPHCNRERLILFPTIDLRDDIVLINSVPEKGDTVLIMKRSVGVVTAVNVNGNYFGVKYLEKDGNTKIGVFPATLLEKIHIQK